MVCAVLLTRLAKMVALQSFVVFVSAKPVGVAIRAIVLKLLVPVHAITMEIACAASVFAIHHFLLPPVCAKKSRALMIVLVMVCVRVETAHVRCGLCSIYCL